MSHLYLKKNYSEENTFKNEVFRPTILHHKKKLNISTPQLPMYYIQPVLEKEISIGTSATSSHWVFCEKRCS